MKNFDLSTFVDQKNEKVKSINKSPTMAKVMDRKFARQSPR
jgi:hypothetical protein